MNIGLKIKNYRLLKGYTTQELADKSGIAQSSVSGVENNRTSPTVDTLKRILDALDVSFIDFFGETTEELSPELIKLIHTAKKMAPEEQKLLNDFLEFRNKKI